MFTKYLFIGLSFIAFVIFSPVQTNAQKKPDSISIKKQTDSSHKNILALDSTSKKFNPRVATFRSAVIPGWGQAYNKKYWKIPIIYGALAITTGVFFYNVRTYKLLRNAVRYRSDTISANDALIDPRFITLSLESLRTYRNEFRQNVDYSVLVFLIFWGLNVVDATVDAHLKAFDVSNDLSLKIKPGFSPNANTTGVSFILTFKDKFAKRTTLPNTHN
jgi:hypothetical protein